MSYLNTFKINSIKKLKRFSIIREAVRAYRNSYKPEWKKISGGIESRIQSNKKYSDKKILIVTGGGGYAAAKQIESLLAVALKLRGASVDVVLCDGILPACFQTTIDWDSNDLRFAKKGTSKINCRTCFSYAKKTYDLVGVNIIKLSTLLNNEETETITKESSSINIEDIESYISDGIHIGEHAYSGCLRFYATSKLVDPHAKKVLRRYFRAALYAKTAAFNLFSENDYSHVLLHHGIYVPQGIFVDSAKHFNFDVTTWHTAYREKTFIFSYGDTYHKTLMNESVSSWDGFEFTDKKLSMITDYLQSRWAGNNDWISFSKQFSEPESDSIYARSEKYDASILMLTNVMWDAQLHYPANAFPTMLDWIITTIEFFISKPNLELIIRVHPAETTGTLPSRQLVEEEIGKKFTNLPKNIKIYGPQHPANTYKLAGMCNTALIFGTKTGVELTAMGIPTIVAGEAWIRGKGLTHDAESPESYLSELKKLPYKDRLPDNIQKKALKYAYHFFFRRMIPISIVKKASGHEVFRYSFDSLSDLEPGADDGLDVICEGILNKKPYVYN